MCCCSYRRLTAPELTQELRNQLIEGAARLADGRDYATLIKQRDRSLIAISKALKA